MLNEFNVVSSLILAYTGTEYDRHTCLSILSAYNDIFDL